MWTREHILRRRNSDLIYDVNLDRQRPWFSLKEYVDNLMFEYWQPQPSTLMLYPAMPSGITCDTDHRESPDSALAILYSDYT